MFRRIQHVHFVGIGGIGMSGIAEVLINLGFRVSGSDLKRSSVTDRLQQMGVEIFEGHSAENVGHPHVVVRSTAPATPAGRARARVMGDSSDPCRLATSPERQRRDLGASRRWRSGLVLVAPQALSATTGPSTTLTRQAQGRTDLTQGAGVSRPRQSHDLQTCLLAWQPRAAANADDAWAARLRPIAPYGLDNAVVVGWLDEGSQQRRIELPDGEAD